MPKHCSTIFGLLYDIVGITIYDFVRDTILATIVDPVRVKSGRTVVNSKHCIVHTALVFLVSFATAEIQISGTVTAAVANSIAISMNAFPAIVSRHYLH